MGTKDARSVPDRSRKLHLRPSVNSPPWLGEYFYFYNTERPNKYPVGIPPVKVFSGQVEAPSISRC